MEFLVRSPGLYTSLQDGGRSGYQAYGVPIGGVLDRRAAATANWLVDRPAGQPVLEITLQGPVLQASAALQIALTGADLSPEINGQPAAMYTTLNLNAGDMLAFGARKSGCRSYLAVGGAWQIAEWLGAAGALLLGKGHWPPGSVLRKNDRLRVLPADPVPCRSIELRKRPFHSRQLSIRLLPGPEFFSLKKTAVTYLSTHAFTLSPDCNRMGCRLLEALPGYRADGELISSGITPGTVQLLPSGKLVILLADAQTTGGYPRIAVVADRDLDDLAQLAPGDRLRFVIL